MELLGGEMVVTRDVNLVDLHLLLLVNVHIDNELARLGDVITLHDVHLGILEALVIVVSLDDNLGLVHHVGCELVTLHNTHLLLQIIVLRFLNAIDIDLRHTWPHGQMYFQINLIVHNAVCLNLHSREESLLPVSLDSICDVIARHSNHLTDGKS